MNEQKRDTKILVVDDIPENVYMLEALLNGHGYEVITAEDGVEALEKARQGSISLIISDILMPKMDGFGLCRAVRTDENLKNIPFIFYTATYTSERDKDFAINLGACRFVIKPSDPDNLISIIKEVLDESKKNGWIGYPGKIDNETDYLEGHQARLINKLSDKIIELERSEERYRSLISCASDAIITLDETGNISSLNESTEKMFGYKKNELIGKSLSCLITPANNAEWSEVFRKVKSGKLPGRFVGEGKLKNGDEIPVEAMLNQMRDREGNILGAISIIRDLIERKRDEEKVQAFCVRLEQAIVRSDKKATEAELANRAKSEFISNLSHEVRTPLNSILGFTDYLLETVTDSEPNKFLKKINKSGQQLLSLINNVLELSNIELGVASLELQSFHFMTMINSTIEMVNERASKKKLEIKLEVEPELLHVSILSDHLKLQRVLLNLLNNAIKFTDEGEIKLYIKQSKKTLQNKNLIFEIHDTGIGIPLPKQSAIFKPFSQIDQSSTKKEQGAGLGLYVCKQMIELMGGYLGVSSIEKRGSVFTFRIPFVESIEPLNGKIIPSTDKSLFLQPLKILLADDSEENRDLIQLYLKKHPCHVDFAVNGDEAINKFKEKSYDIVLMDMQMPGVDGFEATKKIRDWEKEKSLDSIPIIALTGYAFKAERDRCLAAGCTEHVAKPIKKIELLKIIFDHTGKDVSVSDPNCG